MGNNQQGRIDKRNRVGPGYPTTSTWRHRRNSEAPIVSASSDNTCSLQGNLAKCEEDANVTPTFQLKEATEFPVVFRWPFSSTSKTKSVFICGSWDNWQQRIPLVESANDFSTILELESGEHEYKFLVDNKWVVDDCQPKINNDLAGESNIIVIDEVDFEVCDALDKDLASSNAGNHLPSLNAHNDRELAKLFDFTQDIPEKKVYETAHNPPSLPPHLLEVILSKDTPETCDPNMLPEPHHVMLNHLYGQTIKEYRKKYVTTIVYKPFGSLTTAS